MAQVRVTDENFVAPIYGSPAIEPRPFQFVPAELLHPEDMEALLEFAKDENKPTVKGFTHPIYTWTFFKWTRTLDVEPVTRSINRKGIGYCGACGVMVKFDKDRDEKWACRSCGYTSARIFDTNHKMRDQKTPLGNTRR